MTQTLSPAEYVQQHADKIAAECDKYGGHTKESTCDHYNWDRKLHQFMPQIATKLRTMGYIVTSTVNWGVTDWSIVKDVTK